MTSGDLFHNAEDLKWQANRKWVLGLAKTKAQRKRLMAEARAALAAEKAEQEARERGETDASH